MRPISAWFIYRAAPTPVLVLNSFFLFLFLLFFFFFFCSDVSDQTNNKHFFFLLCFKIQSSEKNSSNANKKLYYTKYMRSFIGVILRLFLLRKKETRGKKKAFPIVEMTPIIRLSRDNKIIIQNDLMDKQVYHIIYKSSNRNKVHDKFGIMYFENRITMQIRSRD